MAVVTIGNDKKEVTQGTTFEDLALEYQKDYDAPIALVYANGRMKELSKQIEKDCEVQFITLKDDAGHKAYVRTATLMMMKAIADIPELKDVHAKVEFTIGTGYYVDFRDQASIGKAMADVIEKKMRELSERNLTIVKKAYPTREAVELFQKQGMDDKVKLFKYRKSSSVNVYELDGYYDYYYGYMLPKTGNVRYFEVLPYENGLILNLPEKHKPEVLSKFEPRTKLFSTLKQADEWGDKMGVDSVGDLNDKICKGEIGDLILVQEAFQERRIGEIAKEIAERPGVKFIMIAGPSSSGKTTFSHRLSIQLRTYGLKPHPIALDDYFVDRERTPRDENGDYNFECLEALDVELFNQNMKDLLAGKEVQLPTFNFLTGKSEYKGN